MDDLQPIRLSDVDGSLGTCSYLDCDLNIAIAGADLCDLHKCLVPNCLSFAWYWKSTGFCVEHNNKGLYPMYHAVKYCVECGDEAVPGQVECRTHLGQNSANKNSIPTLDPSRKPTRQKKSAQRRSSIMSDLRAGMKLDDCAAKHKVTVRTVYNARKELYKDME